MAPSPSTFNRLLPIATGKPIGCPPQRMILPSISATTGLKRLPSMENGLRLQWRRWHRRDQMEVATIPAVEAQTPPTREEAMPPLVRQMYNGAWPDKETNDQLIRQRFYNRALDAYVLTLPILN